MSSISITVAVDDIDEVLEAYDRIEVHRSPSGEGGPYVNITGDSPTSGSVEGSNDASFSINGLTLQVRIDDGETQSITIEEDDPVFIDPLVTELESKLTDVTPSNGGTGNLKLTSDTTGTASSVEVVGGTALTELGLTTGKETGVDRRVTLQAGYTEFAFVDNGGETTYYYKVRYYSSLTGQTSDFSDEIPGAQVSPVSSDLITATVDMVGLDGEPLNDVLVTVSNVYDPDALIVSSYGVLGNTVSFATDASGHGEIDLVKGTVVDVTITGSGITRRIEVPSTGSEFDLMSSVSSADDIFQIQTPDIPDAVRRS